MACASASFRAAAKSSTQAKLEDACAELARDLDRPILAAGVDDDNLVENPPNRLQTMPEVFFLVSRDDGEADFGTDSEVSCAGWVI